MKDIILLEINGKKDVLGNIEIETPDELFFSNTTEAVVNNRIFEDLIDEVFLLTTETLVNEYAEKIDNVFVTFIDNNDELICSVAIDKFKPKRNTYRMKLVDWQSSGHIFKYVVEEQRTESEQDHE